MHALSFVRSHGASRLGMCRVQNYRSEKRGKSTGKLRLFCRGKHQFAYKVLKRKDSHKVTSERQSNPQTREARLSAKVFPTRNRSTATLRNRSNFSWMAASNCGRTVFNSSLDAQTTRSLSCRMRSSSLREGIERKHTCLREDHRAF